MDQSDTDKLNVQMPPVIEDNSRINRCIRLLCCGTSGLVSVIPIFCIGLVSGAAGGLLLGATAVVVLQSLELLADNRLLMDQLGKYITDDYYLESKVKEILQWENQVHDIHISIFAVMFGVFSSMVSLAAGIYTGKSTYSLVIKKKGEAAEGEALALAGSVCLTAVVLTGYSLGLAFESFLSITLHVNILLWFIISVVVPCLLPVISNVCFKSHSNLDPITLWLFTPGAAFITFLTSFLSKIRLILVVVLTPTIIAVKELRRKSLSLKLTAAPVPLMLVMSDVFNIAGHQIVSLRSLASTNTSSVVMEAIFVGVLTSLLWMVAIGMSLFVSWHTGEAAKFCATAAGSGTAVLGAIKLALPVLGPCPSIGALMGVAGAVGISFSAAGAATDQYGQEVDHDGFVGRLGVTVGAAVGAFVSSCAHSGLSRIFMALCAATFPAGVFLKLLLKSTSWRLKVCLCIYLLIPAALISFTYTGLFYMMFLHFRILCLSYLCAIYVVLGIVFVEWFLF